VAIHPDISPLDIDLVASGGAVATLSRMIAAAAGLHYDPAAPPEIKRPVASRLLEKCMSLPLHQRKTIPGLDPDRADIIVAGMAVALRTMEIMEKQTLRTNEAGLREGVLQAIIKNGFQWPTETNSRDKV
jgi:exopolyphosphatase/guanosine-5'-triphosphate,3'-diphosphate pyrophosphatase